jgi:hypothetical protein
LPHLHPALPRLRPGHLPAAGELGELGVAQRDLDAARACGLREKRAAFLADRGTRQIQPLQRRMRGEGRRERLRAVIPDIRPGEPERLKRAIRRERVSKRLRSGISDRVS